MDSQRRSETSRRLTYQWRRLDFLILRDRLGELPYFLKPRPISGRLWLDVVFVLLVACVQLTVIPVLTQNVIYIDLTTPWLVYYFVRQDGERSLVLALFASFMIETLTLAPMGLYFCLYPLLLTALLIFRDPLSWRHATPWAVTLAAALTAIALSETLVHGIALGFIDLPLTTCLGILARILLSWVVGMFMIFRFLDKEIEEEIS